MNAEKIFFLTNLPKLCVPVSILGYNTRRVINIYTNEMNDTKSSHFFHASRISNEDARVFEFS